MKNKNLDNENKILKARLDFEKDLMDVRMDFELKKHKLRMEELKFLRENDLQHHERELERGRIKTAEIRKSQMRKFEGVDPYKT